MPSTDLAGGRIGQLATAVNSMFLTIDMSAGQVVASLVIGGFADASMGYAYYWRGAAALALIAVVFVMMNRTVLRMETIGEASQKEAVLRE